MFRLSAIVLILALGALSPALWAQTYNACDLNGDGTVTSQGGSSDVQLAINMSLGTTPCTANLIGAGVCNVVVVQRVINAAISGTPSSPSACKVGQPRSVDLAWAASTSTGVVGYKVYRGTQSGGPYTLLNSAAVVPATGYSDGGVVSGQTYYYVVTAVDGSNNQSVNSNQATAAIP